MQSKAGSSGYQILQECVAETETGLEQVNLLLICVFEKCHF